MKIINAVFATTLFALSLLGTHACADSHGGHTMEGVTVKNAWVRAVPPTSKMSAAYLVLNNGSDEGDKLLSAESDIAQNVELHHVRKKDGMMEMYQVDGIDIPAKGQQELKPGSFHIMLIGLNQPLKKGDEVELTLNFEKAGKITLKVPVKESGASMQQMQMQH